MNLVAVITMLLAFYSAWLQFQQLEESRASSELQQRSVQQLELQTEVLRQLRESTARIASRIEQLLPTQDANTYYVVERATDLRVRPVTKSTSIVKLYPERTVKLVHRKHEWIYVECFEYEKGHPIFGWLLKKKCRMLQH